MIKRALKITMGIIVALFGLALILPTPEPYPELDKDTGLHYAQICKAAHGLNGHVTYYARQLHDNTDRVTVWKADRAFRCQFDHHDNSLVEVER